MLKGDLTLSWPMRGFLGMGGCAAAGISCTPGPFRNLRLPFILPPPVAIVIFLLLIYLYVCVFILSMSFLLILIYSTPFRRVPSA